MKDARHHLKRIQKKVVQDSRREALRQEWDQIIDLIHANEMEVLDITGNSFILDVDKERSREERAPRVVPQSRLAH